ncbi:MAG: SAM-dependent methyltransferase [Rhodobacteraceae bacterium]|nr:SAM-dependent methyltransferase [Paracoccaceae bacterium]
MTNEFPNLDAAYALSSVDDNRKLYSEWAKDYDLTFVEEMDYILPSQVIKQFLNHNGRGPVLDVGAGTGLLGFLLSKQDIGPIDGIDLSQEMLGIAAQKGVYRHLKTADITEPIENTKPIYNGVLSSGTFTHGHVGPDALDNILPLAEEGALFALSINKQHWLEKGFKQKFESLDKKINYLRLIDVPIYGPNAVGEHSNDLGIVAVFERGLNLD